VIANTAVTKSRQPSSFAGEREARELDREHDQRRLAVGGRDRGVEAK